MPDSQWNITFQLFARRFGCGVDGARCECCDTAFERGVRF
jgi:hypothetical protein